MLIPAEIIERKIYLIRGQKVMLDSDLATLYGVPAKVLNQAVKRNIDRFPKDFMLQLTRKEDASLRSQIVTLKKGRGQHRKYSSYVFTEHGVAMLSSVLNSQRAIQVNIAIIRTFVKLRQVLATHKKFAQKLEVLEQRIAKNDIDIQTVAKVIQELLQPNQEEKPKPKIGFAVSKK